jgi:hypothetical protein
MPIPKPVYQLPLQLDLPEGEDSEPKEQALIRAEAAHKALESLYGKVGAPRWLDEYLELIKGGWPWRVAAYIAWASSPRVGREPKTQDELARMYLGLTSDRAISTWRKRNPAIDEIVRVMQAAPLFKHRAEIFTALVAVAVKPEYKSHNDRKLALELMGDYMPAHKVLAGLLGSAKDGDMSEMPEDELKAIAQAAEEVRGSDE